MTPEERETWQKFAKSYEKNNWGWVPESGQIPVGNGKVIHVKKFPSGTVYVQNGRTLEKLTPQWFERMERIVDAEQERAQADKDNGVTDADASPSVPSS